MNSRIIYSFIVFFQLVSFKPVMAQFINLQLRIEPELSTTIDQELNFGVLTSNAGEVSINIGDSNVGIFSIRSYKTQNIYVSLNHPDVLTNENFRNSDTIPLSLSLAYNYDNTNLQSVITLPNNEGYVSIANQLDNNARINSIDNWRELYLYLYGSINVGNITSGEYSAFINLIIDYD